MPQLDLHSYFSAATALIILFLSLIFILHTYYLPKIASTLKFRKKLQLKVENKDKNINFREQDMEKHSGGFLELAQTYVNTMEKIIKSEKSK